MKKHVVLAAGGSGSRMNTAENKIFLQAGDKSILLRSLLLFDGLIDSMVIVCRPSDREKILAIASSAGVSYSFCIVYGGSTRQHSVLNGLQALRAEAEDVVLVHDAARCLTPRSAVPWT